jgi:nucleotide-binding universal stress UspA family protein
VSRTAAELMISEHMTREQLSNCHAQSKERVRNDLESRVDTFCAENPELDACSVVANVQLMEGDASQAILSTAKRIPAQLIVMGSHGHSPIGEMLIGSVAHKVTVTYC